MFPCQEVLWIKKLGWRFLLRYLCGDEGPRGRQPLGQIFQDHAWWKFSDTSILLQNRFCHLQRKMDGSITLLQVQSRVICTSASVCLGGGKQKAEMTLQLQWHQFWTGGTWLVASVCYFHGGGTSAPQDPTHPLNCVWCSSKLDLEIDCPHVGEACSSELSDGIGWHQGPCSSSYKELSSNQVDLEPISATWQFCSSPFRTLNGLIIWSLCVKDPKKPEDNLISQPIL